MAASQSSRGIVAFGKRFFNQIGAGSSREPIHSLSLTIRRAVHVSVYDKNVDEEVRPTVVPDDVIQPESDKYWAPHPETGVFGPETGTNPATFQASSNGGGGMEDSVLEQKAFFRPLEVSDKPIENSEPIEP